MTKSNQVEIMQMHRVNAIFNPIPKTMHQIKGKWQAGINLIPNRNRVKKEDKVAEAKDKLTLSILKILKKDLTD